MPYQGRSARSRSASGSGLNEGRRPPSDFASCPTIPSCPHQAVGGRPLFFLEHAKFSPGQKNMAGTTRVASARYAAPDRALSAGSDWDAGSGGILENTDRSLTQLLQHPFRARSEKPHRRGARRQLGCFPARGEWPVLHPSTARVRTSRQSNSVTTGDFEGFLVWSADGRSPGRRPSCGSAPIRVVVGPMKFSLDPFIPSFAGEVAERRPEEVPWGNS